MSKTAEPKFVRVVIDDCKFWKEYEDGSRTQIVLGNFKSFNSVTEYMRRKRSESGR